MTRNRVGEIKIRAIAGSFSHRAEWHVRYASVSHTTCRSCRIPRAAGAASLLSRASVRSSNPLHRDPPFHIQNFNQALIQSAQAKHCPAKRFPEPETVADATQGLQLATVQKLAQYWSTEYDWRKCEAKLNALPNFITEIDGLDIHFIHVRSPHANALPLIMTHGWPGSFLEFVKVIGPLSDPEFHGVARRTRSISLCPRCPVSASQPGRRRQAESRTHRGRLG